MNCDLVSIRVQRLGRILKHVVINILASGFYYHVCANARHTIGNSLTDLLSVWRAIATLALSSARRQSDNLRHFNFPCYNSPCVAVGYSHARAMHVVPWRFM